MIDVKAYIKLYIHILIILAKICTSTRSETLRTDSRGFYRDSVEMNSHLFATNIQPIAGYWIPIPAVSNWYQREIIVVWSAGIHLLVPPKLEHTKSVFFLAQKKTDARGDPLKYAWHLFQGSRAPWVLPSDLQLNFQGLAQVQVAKTMFEWEGVYSDYSDKI